MYGLQTSLVELWHFMYSIYGMYREKARGTTTKHEILLSPCQIRILYPSPYSVHRSILSLSIHQPLIFQHRRPPYRWRSESIAGWLSWLKYNWKRWPRDFHYSNGHAWRWGLYRCYDSSRLVCSRRLRWGQAESVGYSRFRGNGETGGDGKERFGFKYASIQLCGPTTS